MAIEHICDACGRKIADERLLVIQMTRGVLIPGPAPGAGRAVAFTDLTSTFHVHDGEKCLEKIGTKLQPPEPPEPAATSTGLPA